MLRKFAAAALVLSSPLLVLAQAPAKQTSVARLESANSTPATTVHRTTKRISTGVIAPKIIKSVDIECAPSELAGWDAVNNKASVSFVVGEDGTAHDIQVVRSVNKTLDERVIAAVKQYRFEPAKLDNEPIAINMTIHFLFQHGSQN